MSRGEIGEGPLVKGVHIVHLIPHSEQLVISFSAYIIAECLSMRLLILHVLGWRGVMSCSGMEFVTLGNATKGVACTSTNIRLI